LYFWYTRTDHQLLDLRPAISTVKIQTSPAHSWLGVYNLYFGPKYRPPRPNLWLGVYNLYFGIPELITNFWISDLRFQQSKYRPPRPIRGWAFITCILAQNTDLPGPICGWAFITCILVYQDLKTQFWRQILDSLRPPLSNFKIRYLSQIRSGFIF